MAQHSRGLIPPHVCRFFPHSHHPGASKLKSSIPCDDNYFNCRFSIVLSQFYVTTMSDRQV